MQLEICIFSHRTLTSLRPECFRDFALAQRIRLQIYRFSEAENALVSQSFRRIQPHSGEIFVAQSGHVIRHGTSFEFKTKNKLKLCKSDINPVFKKFIYQ